MKNILDRASAFDHVYDSVIITDVNGVITDWNKASEEIFGHSKSEAVGQLISLVHVPEDTEKVTLDVISSISKSGKWNGRVRSMHKDGTIGKVQSKCVAFYDEEDNLIGTVGINRKININPS